MLSLELVETASRIVISTPRGKERCYIAYIMYFLGHFHGWTLEGESFYCITHCMSAILAKEERPGFCSPFWDSCGYMY